MVALIFIRCHFRSQRRKGAKKSLTLLCAFLCLFVANRFYGTVGVSTTTLLARNVVEVARCKSASALL